jgi:hypothetical protein
MSGLSGRSFDRYVSNHGVALRGCGCAHQSTHCGKAERKVSVQAHLHGIDEGTRIKDHLEDPVQPDLPTLSFCRARALPGISTYHGKIGENWASLSTAIDRSSNLFRRWGTKGDPEGSKEWYDVVMWVNRRYMATTGTTRAIQRPKG